VTRVTTRGVCALGSLMTVEDQKAVCPSKDKIAFVLYGYGLGNSPTLINAANMLAKEGFEVDFYTYGTYLGNVHFEDDTIRVHNMLENDLGFWQRVFGFSQKCLRRIAGCLPWEYQLHFERRTLEKAVKKFVKACKKKFRGRCYNLIIGVEPLGMMAADLLSKRFGVPFAYYNLELHHGPDLKTVTEFAVKEIEKTHNRNAEFTVTLDSERAHLIALENDVDPKTILKVPVCADGEPYSEKSDELRKRLNIGKDKRIILYAGFWADWAMCEDLAKVAQGWPEDWIMVFHTHGYYDPEYLKLLKKYECDQVMFSTEPVVYEDLAAFLASADVGVALYRDLGRNFTLINSASGKLAHYLRSGLPVIVNSYPGIRETVAMYQCGESVDHPGQMTAALHAIFNGYEDMRRAALRCYEENYRFSRHFSHVIERIKSVA